MSHPHETLWARQAAALRDPLPLMAADAVAAGVRESSLAFRADRSFARVLDELGITLYVTREYEHLVVALTTRKGRLQQSFLALPHPSGLVTHKQTGRVFVAATRNPNQIVELVRETRTIERIDRPVSPPGRRLRVARKKYYPGCYYFHDLALIGDQLFANAVGMNGIVRVDLSASTPEPLAWFPKAVELRPGVADTRANYLQLNSIAAGRDLRSSFFSASAERKGARRPGHVNFPVDGRGVIFSGRTRTVVCGGLTRPHSARLHQGTLWVDNSGYGEFGRVVNGKFEVVARLPGWTRGLCLVGDRAFIGVSRVIPKFRRYAPGLTGSDHVCGIHVVHLPSGAVEGKLEWPAGNQIFALDHLDNSLAGQLPQKTLASPVRELSAVCYGTL